MVDGADRHPAKPSAVTMLEASHRGVVLALVVEVAVEVEVPVVAVGVLPPSQPSCPDAEPAATVLVSQALAA